jgi:hypothetical protein
VVSYLRDLKLYGVMHLSPDESSYIILGSHCNGYRINFMIGNYSVSSKEFIALMALIMGPLFFISGRIFTYSLCIGYTVAIIGIVIYILCFSILVALCIVPIVRYYLTAIINTHHQLLRTLEVLSKVFCHYVIIIVIMLMTSSILLLRIVPVARNCLITILMIFFSIIVLFTTLSLSDYCCQFIPACI